ncbi:hypothetical protein [Pseudomonas sp. SCB32]|uniref:hypothetical protein n=1 Tax=Pseudomonas sp. SCB32 TaxID=2653853 RepID=UPI0035563B2F
MFAALNSQQIEASFIRWVSHVTPSLDDQVVAIDGKTVRRSHRRNQRAIHPVSAYGAGLGQVRLRIYPPGQKPVSQRMGNMMS